MRCGFWTGPRTCLLYTSQVAVNVTEVAKESWFTAHLLPLLVVLVIIIVFFMMMNRQAGGGNAKMMNFGKSRAKMTVDGVGKINFDKVAGLEEEKEELQEICLLYTSRCV